MMSQQVGSFDVAIVGGGIHGVGVAQAAAAAGHSVVLLEKSALAHGTSSKSSKLIHGGLRYLESFSWRLVRESLQERELLLRLAPTLVRRQPFFLPIYSDTSRRPLVIRTGLTLYSVLAGLRMSTLFRSVPRASWPSLDGLRLDRLQHVFEFSDAQTDDHALTQAVMRSAEGLGAQLFCPAEFTGAQRSDNSYHVDFALAGLPASLVTRVLVNAAGPWANQLLSLVTPHQPAFPVALIQGTHVELPGEILRGCYYLEMPDRRAVFVLPWKGRTLVGTTETDYDGDPDRVHPLPTEVDYLLDGYQRFFPNRELHLLSSWAGLRVLPRGEGRAFSRSRETHLPVDDALRPRLISIFGGKLTGYRATALKVLTKVAPSLPKSTRRAWTSELPLSRDP